MRIHSEFTIDFRSASVVQLPANGLSGVEMILPGASTSTATSCCSSCGAGRTRK